MDTSIPFSRLIFHVLVNCLFWREISAVCSRSRSVQAIYSFAFSIRPFLLFICPDCSPSPIPNRLRWASANIHFSFENPQLGQKSKPVREKVASSWFLLPIFPLPYRFFHLSVKIFYLAKMFVVSLQNAYYCKEFTARLQLMRSHPGVRVF